MTKKGTAKRELINLGSDKRYVRRDEKGQFIESDVVGHSLGDDRREPAPTKGSRGQADRGER